MKKVIVGIVIALLVGVAAIAIIESVRAVDRSDEYITYLDRKYGW